MQSNLYIVNTIIVSLIGIIGLTLCVKECRIMGTGVDYSGTKDISASGRKCKPWSKRYQLIDGKTSKFPAHTFPENSRKSAKRFCRNPSRDIGGPWCYVDEPNFDYVEKEYCDIPFCHDKDCLVYTKNATSYTILTELRASEGNTSFWLKVWDPDVKSQAEARFLLSFLPVPTTPKQIVGSWHSGVELAFGNSQMPEKYGYDILELNLDILSDEKWTGIWISWNGGFIFAGLQDSQKPFVMREYKTKGISNKLYSDLNLFYGIQGTGLLFATQFCQLYCEVHTSFGVEFSRLWSLARNNKTYDLGFHLRANRSVYLQFYQSPAVDYPCFTLEIGRDLTVLLYQENKDSGKTYLKETTPSRLLDFWQWKEFSVSIFGSHFRLFSKQDHGNMEILYSNHDLFAAMRWFSIGSDQSIAQWTFFCPPGDVDKVEEPFPPNCISDSNGFGYAGSQWTSRNEVPCVPWVSDEVPAEEKDDSKFVDGSALKALNKCRNPSRDPNGPYCFAFSPWEEINVTKRYCDIRSCRSSECRMAGTANDYVGTLATTRSGRKCIEWLAEKEYYETIIELKTTRTTTVSTTTRRRPRVQSMKKRPYSQQELLFQYMPTTPKIVKPPTIKTVKLRPKDYREYFNDSMYTEGSAKNASNYCRNPSRNIAGTWCYTPDPLLPRDLCNVRDCEKPEEYTFLVRGVPTGRRFYVLPEHRSEGLRFSLKAWEPDRPDSITFVFTADDGYLSRYILKIGALDNEKVLLYYRSEDEGMALVKKKTLPHLLFLGKWSNFIIRIPRGRILLYYEGSADPLFEWSHPDFQNAFLPVYYYYGSESGHTIGVAFDPNSSCQIENTKTDRYSAVLPVSAWWNREVASPDKFSLLLRGKGVISLPLLLLPGTSGFYALIVSERDRQVIFTKNDDPNVTIVYRQKAAKSLFTINYWTNITVSWMKNTIEVLSNATKVFHYKHSGPIVLYFFSLGVDPGDWATWTVNCVPTDIDGPAVDGGWSEWGPWACSRSCDGGTGTRKRTCSSPKPNVRGEPCIGPSTMTGRCNEILCGDITDDTMNMIKRRVRQNYTSIRVSESDPVLISSDSDIIKSIEMESPRSQLQWSLNGVFIRVDPDRITIKDHNIEITKAILNDSGVYTMALRRVDGSYSIVKFISLVVIPRKENVIIRETLSLTLTCHCAVLGHLYSGLHVSWLVENKTWKNYGITIPIAVNVDHISMVNRSHGGLWLCIVKQTDLNFEWITNAILVKKVIVLGAPNWRTHLMEDQATRFIFSWLKSEEYVGIFALILFLALIAIITTCSIYLIRFREDSMQNSGRRYRAE